MQTSRALSLVGKGTSPSPKSSGRLLPAPGQGEACLCVWAGLLCPGTSRNTLMPSKCETFCRQWWFESLRPPDSKSMSNLDRIPCYNLGADSHGERNSGPPQGQQLPSPVWQPLAKWDYWTLKCGSSKLRCPVGIEHTQDPEHLVQKR